MSIRAVRTPWPLGRPTFSQLDDVTVGIVYEQRYLVAELSSFTMVNVQRTLLRTQRLWVGTPLAQPILTARHFRNYKNKNLFLYVSHTSTTPYCQTTSITYFMIPSHHRADRKQRLRLAKSTVSDQTETSLVNNNARAGVSRTARLEGTVNWCRTGAYTQPTGDLPPSSLSPIDVSVQCGLAHSDPIYSGDL